MEPLSSGLILVVVLLMSIHVLESQQHRNNLAVFDAILLDDSPSWNRSIQRGMTDTIIGYFVREGSYTVLDRGSYDQIAAELDFQARGFVDDNQVRQLGRQSGAEYIVVIRVGQPTVTSYLVTASIMHVESGAIIDQVSEMKTGTVDILFELAHSVGAQLTGGARITNEQPTVRQSQRNFTERPAPATSIVVGPKAGLNFSWFGGEDWNDLLDLLEAEPGIVAFNDAKTDFFFGGYIEYRHSPFFSSQIELLFGSISGGSTIEDVRSSEQFEFTIKTRVISIPVLLKPRIPLINGDSFYFLGGMEFTFVRGDIEERSVMTGEDADTFYYEPWNRFVPMLSFGIGYETALHTGLFSADIRYAFGFADIFENAIINANSINLFLSYGFRL